MLRRLPLTFKEGWEITIGAVPKEKASTPPQGHQQVFQELATDTSIPKSCREPHFQYSKTEYSKVRRSNNEIRSGSACPGSKKTRRQMRNHNNHLWKRVEEKSFLLFFSVTFCSCCQGRDGDEDRVGGRQKLQLVLLV